MNGMAATLDDVLKAIANQEKRFDVFEKRFDVFERRFDVFERHFDVFERHFDALEKKVDAHQAEMRERFDALDEKTELVRDILEKTRRDAIRDLRGDVNAPHKGLARAHLPGVPADLPSQVRAKRERPSKPATRPKRRAR